MSTGGLATGSLTALGTARLRFGLLVFLATLLATGLVLLRRLLRLLLLPGALVVRESDLALVPEHAVQRQAQGAGLGVVHWLGVGGAVCGLLVIGRAQRLYRLAADLGAEARIGSDLGRSGVHGELAAAGHVPLLYKLLRGLLAVLAPLLESLPDGLQVGEHGGVVLVGPFEVVDELVDVLPLVHGRPLGIAVGERWVHGRAPAASGLGSGEQPGRADVHALLAATFLACLLACPRVGVSIGLRCLGGDDAVVKLHRGGAVLERGPLGCERRLTAALHREGAEHLTELPYVKSFPSSPSTLVPAEVHAPVEAVWAEAEVELVPIGRPRYTDAPGSEVEVDLVIAVAGGESAGEAVGAETDPSAVPEVYATAGTCAGKVDVSVDTVLVHADGAVNHPPLGIEGHVECPVGEAHMACATVEVDRVVGPVLVRSDLAAGTVLGIEGDVLTIDVHFDGHVPA